MVIKIFERVGICSRNQDIKAKLELNSCRAVADKSSSSIEFECVCVCCDSDTE